MSPGWPFREGFPAGGAGGRWGSGLASVVGGWVGRRLVPGGVAPGKGVVGLVVRLWPVGRKTPFCGPGRPG